jgi:hypothetical protein
MMISGEDHDAPRSQRHVHFSRPPCHRVVMSGGMLADEVVTLMAAEAGSGPS